MFGRIHQKLGTAGFIISAMNSFYVFMKFAKLWAIQEKVRSTK